MPVVWFERVEQILKDITELLAEKPKFLGKNESAQAIARGFHHNLVKWKAHLRIARGEK